MQCKVKATDIPFLKDLEATPINIITELNDYHV